MSKNYKEKIAEERIEKFKSSPTSVLGISFSENTEQQRLLRLMQKPDLPYIFLLGDAGTGKTFATVAGALDLVLMQRKYKEIWYCRAAKEVADGEGMGYLPGELDEKFALYCMPLVDNLNSIAKKCKSVNVDYIMKNTIQCVPPNYMRGRSFEDAIIIVDEAQNMTYDQIQTLMTRISDTCKIVFMGSLNQIDLKNKKVSENGFKLVMDCCKQNGFEQEGLCGFVEFVQSMRSPFCVKVDKALTLFKQERNH